ncbi:MAG: hypothetical protein P8P36_08650 [Akkermansiaceae bacterium]|nr:hypothetical protein [Akkermansiaceae bacterium]
MKKTAPPQRTTVLPSAERRAILIKQRFCHRQRGVQAPHIPHTHEGDGVAEGKEQKARRLEGLLDRSKATCSEGVSRLAEPANRRKR